MAQVLFSSMNQAQQEMIKMAVVLLMVGSHSVLPAGHRLLLSPTIIAALTVVQVCSLAFAVTTSSVIDAPKLNKVIGEEEAEVATTAKSKHAMRELSLEILMALVAAGGLLALFVAMKVLGALGLLTCPTQGLALALLLAGAVKFALKAIKKGDGTRHEGGCTCGLCPSCDDAPVDDDGCPYDEVFWAELQLDTWLDGPVQDLADDVCPSFDQEE